MHKVAPRRPHLTPTDWDSTSILKNNINCCLCRYIFFCLWGKTVFKWGSQNIFNYFFHNLSTAGGPTLCRKSVNYGRFGFWFHICIITIRSTIAVCFWPVAAQFWFGHPRVQRFLKSIQSTRVYLYVKLWKYTNGFLQKLSPNFLTVFFFPIFDRQRCYFLYSLVEFNC